MTEMSQRKKTVVTFTLLLSLQLN